MTKAEIVSDISRKTGIDMASVLSVVEGFMTAVKDSLSNEGTFTYAASSASLLRP